MGIACHAKPLCESSQLSTFNTLAGGSRTAIVPVTHFMFGDPPLEILERVGNVKLVAVEPLVYALRPLGP